MINLWSEQVKHRIQSQRAKWEIVGAALLLLLLLVIFFWPAVIGGRVLLPADLIFDTDPLWQALAPAGYIHPSNPILSDQVFMYFPWKVFTLRSLARSQLPLWNPQIEGGLPFVGNTQSALFSPFNLLSYLVPLYSSYIVTAIVRLLVAGIFTFLFAREIGLGAPGAVLAMIVFTFSGPMIVWLGYPLSPVIVWLPAMLWTIERALTRQSILYAVASGLTIDAQFLGGHPETCFYVMLAWAAYALYRAVSLEGWRSSKLPPQLARIATAAVIGILLALAQLLPFAEALFQSATPSMKEAQIPGSLSSLLVRILFEWRDWPTAITALLPHYFGAELDGSYWFPYSNSVEQNLYVGVLPLTLAATAVLRHIRQYSSPRRNLILFFTLMAVVCLGVALRLPVLNAVNYLPLFNLASNGRLRLIYAFAIAVLAGLGLDEIVEQKDSRRTALSILILLALTSLFLITVAYGGLVVLKDQVIRSGRDFMQMNWGSPYLSRPLEYYYALVEERYEKKLALFRPSHLVMYLPVLMVFAWFALHRWREKWEPLAGARMWGCAALGLTLLDAFWVGRSVNPTIAPLQIFPTPGAIQFLQQDPDIYRVSGTGLILQPNTSMVFGLSDVRGYDMVVPRRYTDIIDRLEGHYRFHFHSLFVRAGSPLFDLLNVKYVLTDQPLDGKWELAYSDAGSVKVYRNRDVLPRAFIVHQAQVVNGAARSLERTTDSDFDFRKTVVLEERPAGWVEPPIEPATTAAVHITDYEPNQIKLRVETAVDGLLVLTDNYASGWEAGVDGRLTPVYVADHAFRAVVVPAGAHQVEFEYNPLSFKLGLAVSLLTAAGLLFTSIALGLKHIRGRDR